MDRSPFPGRSALAQTVLLIANDSVPNDDLRKTTTKMAKPPAVKLVIKNIADSIEAIKAALRININFFIVVESAADAPAGARITRH